MILDKQDWRKLQTTLVVLAVVIISIVGLFVWAESYTSSQTLALQMQQNQLNSARQRYQSSGAEKDMITEYLPKYQVLINKGFVGEEKRIEWIEALRTQHRNHKLFSIKYDIGQQEEYKPVFAPSLGGFVLHRSTMKLDLDMLHEGDLLQLTESLGASEAAPFMLRDCEITRLNAGAALNNQLVANLHSHCELDWLTLREPVSTATGAVQ